MKHYNTSISEDAMRIFNTKSFDNISSEVSPIIQPTIEIKRHCNICKAIAATNNTSATIYTTPTDKDFYLVGASLSVIKDVTGVSNNSKINIIVDGISVAILSISSITLTPQYDSMTNSWSNPIKCDRGTVITVTNSSATANCRSDATIQGYTVETTKGV